MKLFLVLISMFVASQVYAAGDVDAGKARAAACFACHGQNGMSVSGNIPNLAGQNAQYLSAQLKAFRGGTRKNPLMNAMAGQLTDTDIDNITAYFSSLATSERSKYIAAINRTRVTFPDNYKNTFTKYTTINFPKRKQVRDYYANEAALKAAGRGERLPNGSEFLVEVYKPKLDANNQPIKGDDGFFVKDKLIIYTAMAKNEGWGDDIPSDMRNGDWNYAVFKGDKTLNSRANQAVCFACHKPEVDASYVFSLKPLISKAHMMQ